MSDSVGEAFGNALQFTADERIHLLRLARPGQVQVVRRPYGQERLRASVLALVDSAVRELPEVWQAPPGTQRHQPRRLTRRILLAAAGAGDRPE
jgi:hypothetical protein